MDSNNPKSTQLDTLECFCTWCGGAIRSRDAKYARTIFNPRKHTIYFCSMGCVTKDAGNYQAAAEAAKTRGVEG